MPGRRNAEACGMPTLVPAHQHFSSLSALPLQPLRPAVPSWSGDPDNVPTLAQILRRWCEQGSALSDIDADSGWLHADAMGSGDDDTATLDPAHPDPFAESPFLEALQGLQVRELDGEHWLRQLFGRSGI